jgi:hypothetical protein
MIRIERVLAQSAAQRFTMTLGWSTDVGGCYSQIRYGAMSSRVLSCRIRAASAVRWAGAVSDQAALDKVVSRRWSRMRRCIHSRRGCRAWGESSQERGRGRWVVLQ